MYHCLPKRVMCQFDYLHIISRPPHEFAPPDVHRRDLQAIFDDFKSHLVLEEYRRGPDLVYWVVVEDYMTWFCKMPHHIITSDAPGEPLRPANQEAFKLQDEHAKNVTTVCLRIAEMDGRAIEAKLLEDGTPQLASWIAYLPNYGMSCNIDG